MDYREMKHSEELYPNPYTFTPERVFNKNGELNLDHRVLAFPSGTGRRTVNKIIQDMCRKARRECNRKSFPSATYGLDIGHSTDSSQCIQGWLTTASLLASFNITKAKDEHGSVIEILDDLQDSEVER